MFSLEGTNFFWNYLNVITIIDTILLMAWKYSLQDICDMIIDALNCWCSFTMDACSISVIIITFIYVISPIDVIPDFIPVIGWIDDVYFVQLCTSIVLKEVERHQRWRGQ